MAQVTFKDDEFYGLLHFDVTAREYEEGIVQLEVRVNSFDDFTNYMNNYYKGNFNNIFENLTIESLEFTGISFEGRQETERFSIDILEGWRRATIIFDEKKFGDVNIDKLRRMKKIMEE